MSTLGSMVAAAVPSGGGDGPILIGMLVLGVVGLWKLYERIGDRRIDRKLAAERRARQAREEAERPAREAKWLAELEKRKAEDLRCRSLLEQGWVTKREASERLGIKGDSVVGAIKRGSLEGDYSRETGWIVSNHSIERRLHRG